MSNVYFLALEGWTARCTSILFISGVGAINSTLQCILLFIWKGSPGFQPHTAINVPHHRDITSVVVCCRHWSSGNHWWDFPLEAVAVQVLRRAGGTNTRCRVDSHLIGGVQVLDLECLCNQVTVANSKSNVILLLTHSYASLTFSLRMAWRSLLLSTFDATSE